MTTLRAVLAEAGFHGSGLDTAVAVALAESGGRPTAHNGNAGTGDNSFGLFQINMLGNLGPARLKEYGLTSYTQLYDPRTNAQIAYKLSQGGTNWGPWTTYTRGTYRHYLGQDPPLGGTGDRGAAGGDYNSGGDDKGGHSSTGTGTDTDGSHTTQADLDGTGTVGHHTSAFDIGTGTQVSSLMPSHDEMAAQVSQLLGVPATPITGSASATPHTTLPTGAGTDTALHTFISSAVAQRGDAWVFGAKGNGQANPTAFDCSGLTKWAAHQAGVTLPDGAAYQYRALKAEGMLIPVDQAIHTPGALLFHFDGEPPPGEEPAVAHVAISLGNGRTIEAANPRDGVNEFNARGRFNFAAIIPGIGTSEPSSSTSNLLGDLTAHSASGLAGSDDLSGSWDFADTVPSTGHGHPLGTTLGAGSQTPLTEFGHDDGGHHAADLGFH